MAQPILNFYQSTDSIATSGQLDQAQFHTMADDGYEWWVKGHTWYGDANNLVLDAKAGGCFCEISGDNQVMHMLVTFVKPGEEVKMVGGLGPLQMMGIHGSMSWRFEAMDGGTRITQTYNVTGYAPGGLSDLADIVDAVQTGQLNALIAKLSAP